MRLRVPSAKAETRFFNAQLGMGEPATYTGRQPDYWLFCTDRDAWISIQGLDLILSLPSRM